MDANGMSMLGKELTHFLECFTNIFMHFFIYVQSHILANKISSFYRFFAFLLIISLLYILVFYIEFFSKVFLIDIFVNIGVSLLHLFRIFH